MNTRFFDIIADSCRTLGLWNPCFTRCGKALVLITALPCGKGETARPDPLNPVGSIAAFAQKNYYREMVRRLKRLIRAAAVPCGARIFCNSRMPEKEIALRAGLGVRGKNSLILLPGAGSLFVLGGIIIPAEYEGAAHRPPPREKSGENESCGNCRACIEACPSGAIRDSGNIDRNLCIQAFTAEARPVPAEVREKWGITLYGCQICQQVCPRNKNAPQAAETSCGVLGPSCELKKILACPDGDLRKGLFRGTVLDRSWIDPIALKRSALLAAARQMAKNILPLVAAYTGHPHPLLRETAQWAGTRIEE